MFLRVFLIWFSVIVGLRAQPSAFHHIDQRVAQATCKPVRNLNDLVQIAHTFAKNDAEKARFYFTWISQNVQYDTLLSNQVDVAREYSTPQYVFDNRRGVCSGYANLLNYLCLQSGIPSRVVCGIPRTTDGADTVDFHAWNVMRLDGHWYACDVTWAANYWHGTRAITPAFDGYFMQLSGDFAQKHLPFDPIFQLSDYIVTKNAFLENDFSQKTRLKLVESYAQILDEEATMDSTEALINSYMRAQAFMPDIAVVGNNLRAFQLKYVNQHVKKAENLWYNYQNNGQPNALNWQANDLNDAIRDLGVSLDCYQKALEVADKIEFSAQDDTAQKHHNNLILLEQRIRCVNSQISVLRKLLNERATYKGR